jgi:hypothetical protein
MWLRFHADRRRGICRGFPFVLSHWPLGYAIEGHTHNVDDPNRSLWVEFYLNR